MNINISKAIGAVTILGCLISGSFLSSIASADDKSVGPVAAGINQCTERYNLCIEAGQIFYDRCIDRGNTASYCAGQQTAGQNACKRAMERCWKEPSTDSKSSKEQNPCKRCVCSGGTVKPECMDCCK